VSLEAEEEEEEEEAQLLEEEEVMEEEKRDSPHTQDLLLHGRLLEELLVGLKVSGWVPRSQEEGEWGGEATSVPR
jgi:hypothetical protein